jgi:hypothetical protein
MERNKIPGAQFLTPIRKLSLLSTQIRERVEVIKNGAVSQEDTGTLSIIKGGLPDFAGIEITVNKEGFMVKGFSTKTA